MAILLLTPECINAGCPTYLSGPSAVILLIKRIDSDFHISFKLRQDFTKIRRQEQKIPTRAKGKVYIKMKTPLNGAN
jgi:hypothetical protein